MKKIIMTSLVFLHILGYGQDYDCFQGGIKYAKTPIEETVECNCRLQFAEEIKRNSEQYAFQINSAKTEESKKTWQTWYENSQERIEKSIYNCFLFNKSLSEGGTGGATPSTQKPLDEPLLQDFIWLDQYRPKVKEDIFRPFIYKAPTKTTTEDEINDENDEETGNW